MNPIQIIFKGVDQTKGATASVKAGLEGVQGAAKKTGASFDVAMGVLAANQVQQFANAVSGFMTDSIREASEMQDAMSQIEQVLQSTGKASTITAEEIADMAESFSRVSKFEDDMVASGQLVLLQFTNLGEEVLPRATQAMIDMATRMKMDLPSAAKIVGKAMEGEIGSLARLGIVIDDATKKQIEGLMKVGDVAGAQAIILEQFEAKFGGAAEASTKTWTGAMANLEKSVANLKGAFGEVILNSPSVTAAINHIADAINWLADNFSKLPEGAKLGVAGLVGFVAILGKAMPALISLKILLPGIGAAFGGLAAKIGGIAGIFGAIKAAAVGAAAAIGAISLPVLALAAAIVVLIGVIIVFGKDAVKNFASLAKLWVQILVAAFNRIIFEFQKFINNWIARIRAIPGQIRLLWNNIGRSIVDGIRQGLESAWTGFLASLQAKFNALPEWAKSLIGASSPAKKFVPIGESIAQGIGVGFAHGMKNLVMPAMGASLQPAPAFARASAPMMAGGNGTTITGNNFAFYSPLTHDERRIIRREQEDAAQREVLRSLR